MISAKNQTLENYFSAQLESDVGRKIEILNTKSTSSFSTSYHWWHGIDCIFDRYYKPTVNQQWYKNFLKEYYYLLPDTTVYYQARHTTWSYAFVNDIFQDVLLVYDESPAIFWHQYQCRSSCSSHIFRKNLPWFYRWNKRKLTTSKKFGNYQFFLRIKIINSASNKDSWDKRTGWR